MANVCHIKIDPASKLIHARVIEDSSGAENTAVGSVVIDLDDLAGTNRVARFREFHFLDFSAGCAEKKCWILMTEPEAI